MQIKPKEQAESELGDEREKNVNRLLKMINFYEEIFCRTHAAFARTLLCHLQTHTILAMMGARDELRAERQRSELNESQSPFLVLPQQQSPDLSPYILFFSSSSSRGDVMNN